MLGAREWSVNNCVDSVRPAKQGGLKPRKQPGQACDWGKFTVESAPLLPALCFFMRWGYPAGRN